MWYIAERALNNNLKNITNFFFSPTFKLLYSIFQDNRVHIGPKIEMRVVALGLDGAGKTSILFKLKQNEFMSCRSPTIGFNVEPIEYKNLRFNIWDIGGQPKLRPLWKHYFLNTQVRFMTFL